MSKLQEFLSLAYPPRPGLVPKSRDYEHPDKWIREKISTPQAAAFVQTVQFKRPYDIDKYGKTARIVNVQTIVDRPHPGHVVSEIVDLVTENGRKIQWQRRQVTAHTKPISVEDVKKAVVPTPMKDGHFDPKQVVTGDSVWISVSDEHSPLHGRHVLVTKRPDGLFAITSGGYHGKDEEVEARRHQVLTGTPQKTERDEELDKIAEEAEAYNEPIIAAKKEAEQEARKEIKEAASEMLDALGVKKLDKKQLAENKEAIQEYVKSIVQDEDEAKKIADSISRQIVAAQRKVADRVQRERQLVVAKIGKKLAILSDEKETSAAIEEVTSQLPEREAIAVPMPDVKALEGMQPNEVESAVANHFDHYANDFFEEEHTSPEIKEDAPKVVIEQPKMELKSKEDLEKAVHSVKKYWEKRKDAEAKREAIKKVPLTESSPSTIAALQDSIQAANVSMEELEDLTNNSYEAWMRNNSAIALYEAASEYWNNKKSLVDSIGDTRKIDTTMKYHLDGGAAVALASLAKLYLGSNMDTLRLIQAGNIELAASLIAFEVRQKAESSAAYNRVIGEVRSFNSTNQEATEKRALERHAMLKKQYDEVQRQKASGELLDRIRVSSLESDNLLEQKKNLGAAIGSLQAAATFYDQLEKFGQPGANQLVSINVGNSPEEADHLAERLKLTQKRYVVDTSDPENIVLKTDISSLGKLTTEQKSDSKAIEDKESIKTDTSGTSYDDSGNLVVDKFDVPNWKKEWVDDAGNSHPYKWRLEQRNDINWLLDNTKKNEANPLGIGGGLITRVTGSGKTNAALGFFGHQLASDPNYKGLVVVPKGRAEQWVQEAKKFTDMPVELIPDGTARDKVDEMLLNSKPGTVYVTGHREAARSAEMLAALQTNHKLGAKFHGFVIDEPQELQARGGSGNVGEMGKRIMRLPVDHRIGLTATPARKNPTEVYDLAKWTSGGAKELGSKASFQRIFSGFGSGTNAADTAIAKTYFQTIKPYISGDKLTDPGFKVKHNDVEVRRTPLQIQKQKEIEQQSADFIAKRRQELIADAKANPNHPLRRVQNWEAQLPKRATEAARKEVEQQHIANMDDGLVEDNAKFTALKDALVGAPDKKHVLFLDSKVQRNTVNKALQEAGFKPGQIKNLAPSTTEMTGAEMSERAKEFRTNSGIRVILIDNKSASGYNLQSGDILHVLGSPSDAASLLQAQGRIARAPRKGDVEVKTYSYGDNPVEMAKWNSLNAQLKVLRASSPGLFAGEERKSSDELEKGQPPREGLVPKSGDYEHPYRWVKSPSAQGNAGPERKIKGDSKVEKFLTQKTADDWGEVKKIYGIPINGNIIEIDDSQTGDDARAFLRSFVALVLYPEDKEAKMFEIFAPTILVNKNSDIRDKFLSMYRTTPDESAKMLLAHEAGHVLFYSFTKQEKRRLNDLYEECGDLDKWPTRYSSDNEDEFVAESITLWLFKREKMVKHFPSISAFLSDVFKRRA